MTTVSLILVMLLAVVISGFIGRVLPRPVPLALIQIVLGAVIAALFDFHVPLDPQIFFLLFLPPLLFLDGWRLPKHTLMRDKWTVLELALGLVLFTVVGMGFFINWLIPAIPLAAAFALAAVLSPTDPVAVTALGNRIPMPKRLLHILEGESLLNDASGLVCLRFAVAAALTGTFSLADATLTVDWLAVGGIATGVLVTYGITEVKGKIAKHFGEESGTQILVSLLIPFGAYMAAEHLGCSGILAAVAAGVTMGYAETTGYAMAATRVRRNVVWDTLQFAAHGAIFVLLGQQMPAIVDGAVRVVHETGHQEAWWLAVYVGAITLALGVLRFAWVFASIRFTMLSAWSKGATVPKVPLRVVAAMSVAGVRGAVTLAGILTLPLMMNDGSAFPARDLLIFMAAGVIILSLLVATFSLPHLMQGLQLPTDPADKDEELKTRAAAAKAAMEAVELALHEMSAGKDDADLYAGAAARVLGQYRHRMEDNQKRGQEREQTRKVREIERKLRLVGLKAERAEIFRLGRSRTIADDLMRKLVREIDLIEARDGA
jgi:CPA1 family monovalent cation:H+ antiporter